MSTSEIILDNNPQQALPQTTDIGSYHPQVRQNVQNVRYRGYMTAIERLR